MAVARTVSEKISPQSAKLLLDVMMTDPFSYLRVSSLNRLDASSREKVRYPGSSRIKELRPGQLDQHLLQAVLLACLGELGVQLLHGEEQS